jgi:hypothetical protein
VELDDRVKQLDYHWKIFEASFERNFKIANVLLVGNAAALVACVAVYRDFKDKIALDTVGSAGHFFCYGMIAASVMLGINWLAAELTTLKFQRVAACEFDDEGWDEFSQSFAHLRSPPPWIKRFGPALAATVIAVPYAFSAFCFFGGIVTVANNLKCILAC